MEIFKFLRALPIQHSKGGSRASTSVSQTACLLTALGLVLLLFGDVLFRRASLAPIDYEEPIQNAALAPIAHSVIPERPGRRINAGQGDTGSGAFQFEPGQLFLTYCLRHGESPYWDPYTGAGTLGPETSAELKFSPVSAITALLGGSSRVLSFILVAFYFVGAYSLLRVCTGYLGLSIGAGTVAAALYFLNGFALSNLYNPIGQPYFLGPVLLLSMLAISGSLTKRNMFLALTAHVLFFATTFFPTAVLCLIVVYAFTLSFRLSEDGVRWAYILKLHIALPCAALFLLSFLYFPIFEAMKTDLDMVSLYNTRLTPGVHLVNLLSFFTPKHFWESYGAFYEGTSVAPRYQASIHHLGIVGPLIAAHAFSRLCNASRAVLLVLAGCVAAAAGQIWGIFPFTLIDRLPFFSFVRNDYWSSMVILALVLLAAYGYDAITAANAFRLPVWLLLSVIVTAFFYASVQPDQPVGDWAGPYVVGFWFILCTSAAILWMARQPRLTAWSRRLILFALIAEGIFYMNGLRPYRSNRDQHVAPAILWVKSEIEKHPGSRLLNIGTSGVFPNWGSALQIPQLGDLNTAAFPWYRDFFYHYVGTGLFLSLAHPADTFSFSDASLSLAGVRYIMVDRTISGAIERLSSFGYSVVQGDSIRVIYENPHVLPRSFIAASFVKADSLPMDIGFPATAAATSTDSVLASQAARLGIQYSSGLDRGGSRMSSDSWSAVRDYHHDRVRIACKLDRPGILVLTDSWSPRWRATVDGSPAYVGRVDITFRGIALPAGEHEVVFWYKPVSLVLGEWVSATAVVGLCILFWQWPLIQRNLGGPLGDVRHDAATH